MQLRLDAADRLVELVEERRSPVPAEEAAESLFALARTPVGLARGLLEDVVRADARLAWRGSSVALAAQPGHDLPLEEATYVVVDLETTGLRAATAAICEIGAVRVEALEPVATFETLVNPRRSLPGAVAALTGLEDRDLARAPSAELAVRRFLTFAGDAVLVAHNARFDLSFLDREVERSCGSRLGPPVVDTVGLARRLLAGRGTRSSLAALAHFFGTPTRPCHRALPDARATAEILVSLIGLAQERGATTVADLCELAAPRARRVYAKRSLVFGAPRRPGVYLFHDPHGQVLYVGRARDLRARLRSYFTTPRQRPAVEAALGAACRVEWRVLGSELEAALEELRLITELRPPANARSARPDRYVYLRPGGEGVIVTRTPTPFGPIKSRRRAESAARALRGSSQRELEHLLAGGPLPRLHRKLRDLAECLRYEDAARLRDRITALERVVAALGELERLRAIRACLLVPAAEEGFASAFFVAAGRVVTRRAVPLGGGARLELEAGLAEARAAEATGPCFDPDAADELLLVGSFLRRPPPELTVCQLELAPMLRALGSPRAGEPVREGPLFREVA